MECSVLLQEQLIRNHSCHKLIPLDIKVAIIWFIKGLMRSGPDNIFEHVDVLDVPLFELFTQHSVRKSKIEIIAPFAEIPIENPRLNCRINLQFIGQYHYRESSRAKIALMLHLGEVLNSLLKTLLEFRVLLTIHFRPLAFQSDEFFIRESRFGVLITAIRIQNLALVASADRQNEINERCYIRIGI